MSKTDEGKRACKLTLALRKIHTKVEIEHIAKKKFFSFLLCMRINSNNYFQNQINFKSTARSVYNPNRSIGDIIEYTTLLRDDVNWFWLANYMNFNFEDKEKVNVVLGACSDGTEAHSLAIALDQTNSNKANRNKYLPIMASDIDKVLIKFAKSGRINLTSFEAAQVNSLQNYFSNPDFSLDIPNDPLVAESKSYEISPYLKWATNFKNSDILTEVSNIEDRGNSVVLCRNATPYMETDYLKSLIDAVNNKLKSRSLFILGSIDNSPWITEGLSERFYKINQNIYRKIK